MKSFLVIYFLAFTSVLFSQQKTSFTNLDVFELEWAQNPEISPDGKSIVYQRRGMDIMKDRKTSTLWIMNSDGANHMKLTSNDVNETNATWSPDGTQIAFVSSTKEGAEIFVYWIKTGKMARLTQLEKSLVGSTGHQMGNKSLL